MSDAPQSMCETAGLAAGLDPRDCSDPNGPCRYHQGVEDAWRRVAEMPESIGPAAPADIPGAQ